jgi:ribosome-associated translation inhibitor RaiA
MQSPAQVSFRGFDPTPELRALVDKRIKELERYYNHITTLRVTVDHPHHNHHRQGHYHVIITLDVPGEQIIVDRSPERDDRQRKPGPAVRDAFDAARRQLQDYVRQLRGHVKLHDSGELTGTVASLPLGEDFGFIAGVDGAQVWFHRNSVDGDFDALEIGRRVAYVEGEALEGARAASVRPLGD